MRYSEFDPMAYYKQHNPESDFVFPVHCNCRCKPSGFEASYQMITIDTAVADILNDLTRREHYYIDKIYVNIPKGTVVVAWDKGNKTKVKLAKGETLNIYNAVAAAVMKRKYGSNSAFKKHIENNLGFYDDRAYLLASRLEASEIYGGYENFVNMVNDKIEYSRKKGE